MNSIAKFNAVDNPSIEFSQWWSSESQNKEALEGFFAQTRGKKPCIIRGDAGRFQELISWDELNWALKSHRLQTPQLRLFKDGAVVSESEYADTLYSSGHSTAYKKLIPAEIHRLLNEGASVVLDGVDQIFPKVEYVAKSMESKLGEVVNANLYCTIQNSQGFSVHCDTHDVYITQLAGSKKWTLYQGGRNYPLEKDTVHESNPSLEVLWEGVLHEGDVLYIPRGVWHEAFGDTELSMHVTFGCHHASGIDFYAWLIDTLRANTELRKDLVSALREKGEDGYMAFLREVIRDAITPEVLNNFLNYRNIKSDKRNSFGLPDAVYNDGEFDDLDEFELCTVQQCLEEDSAQGVVKLFIGGKCLKFSDSMKSLLQFFVTRVTAFTFKGAYVNIGSESKNRYNVALVLRYLIRQGVLRKIT